VILEGREPALTVLREALGRAAVGRGRLAVVSGDAGIGKSSVASALAAEAEARGFDVVWGRAWEFADAPPYFPLRAALRALGIDPLRSDRREDGGSFRLWEDVVEALARTGKPVAWFLEDLHAADLLTLDLLTFLGQAIRGLSVLVVGTMRPHDSRLDDRALQRLIRMARDGIDLRLAPLAKTEIATVAERVCGAALPAATLAKLVEMTGGNPLFVVECARAFKAAGTFGSLPPTVKQVVLERFRELPNGTCAALVSGAILGREFSAAAVGRMLDALPARVIDDVLPALRSGLVQEVEPGRFAFSHVLVRDAVDASVAAEERAHLHRLAEAALAKAPETVDVIVERARHALEAASLGDARRAVDHARRAIAVLERDGAHDRAWAFCRRLESGSTEVASMLEPDDWMTFASIARAAGRHAECRRLCDRVLERARTELDAMTFARAALLVGADIRPGIVDRSLVALLEEARTMLGDADERLACRLTARLAGALQPHDDERVPIMMARGAIERARGLGDDVLLDVLDLGVSALVDYAPIDERLAAYEELRALASARGDRARVLRARARLALDHAYVGDFAAFSHDVDESLRLAAEIGHPRFRWRPLFLASMRALMLGDFVESERAYVEVKELVPLTDDPAVPLSIAMHGLHRALLFQREDELRPLADDLSRLFSSVAYGETLVWFYRAIIAGRLEDAPAARRALDALVPTAAFIEREVSGAGSLAEAIALVGTDEHRRRVRAFLLAHANAHVIGGHVPIAYEGSVERALALLDASLGDVDAGLARLGRALARLSVQRPWIAQYEYDTARILVRAGRAAEARRHVERASNVATEIGLERLAARARMLTSESVERAPAARVAFALAKEGDVWRVSYGPAMLRIRDSRGVQLLARLVERADEEIHVLALASDEGGAGLAETNAGDVLDEKARRTYRDRLRELGEEIEEAERNADRGRMERLHRERSMLEDEISRAIGIGGRARKGGSATERARVNVQRRLKDAIARIAEADAAAGKFLERAVRTGTFCCYRP
jgi:tetratricopeptide (TPR) repeat protein